MTTVKTIAANPKEPIQISKMIGNIGQHFVIGPRESDNLRNRIVMEITSDNTIPRVIFLDSGKIIDHTADILVIPIVQLEMKFWI